MTDDLLDQVRAALAAFDKRLKKWDRACYAIYNRVFGEPVETVRALLARVEKAEARVRELAEKIKKKEDVKP